MQRIDKVWSAEEYAAIIAAGRVTLEHLSARHPHRETLKRALDKALEPGTFYDRTI
jgi:hypothetical protein